MTTKNYCCHFILTAAQQYFILETWEMTVGFVSLPLLMDFRLTVLF
jgi:hypothetical protein